MDVSALFVNYNSWPYLAAALASLEEHPPRRGDGSPYRLEVIVVDNASTQVDGATRDEVLRRVAALGGWVVQSEYNGGYAKGMNQAYARASGRFVLVCNPDLLFTANALSHLVRGLEEDESLGAIAPAVFADPGLEIHLPIHVLPTPLELVRTTLGTLSVKGNRAYSRRRTARALPVWETTAPIEEPMFGGCCVLLPRAVIEDVGFFDERFPLYFEDTDLARRVRASGRRLVRTGDARVVHLYDRSSRTNRTEAMRRHDVSRRQYFETWHGWIGRLTLAACTFLLESSWGQRRAEQIRRQPFETLEPGSERPTLRLPRTCERFLVEISNDPFFLLTAAAFGSDDRWTPSPWVAEHMESCWLRVLDLSAGKQEELGRWKYDPNSLA